jgi:hypothetical protein
MVGPLRRYSAHTLTVATAVVASGGHNLGAPLLSGDTRNELAEHRH